MEVYLACSRSAKRKPEQLEWGEPGGEKQEKRKVKERARSPITQNLVDHGIQIYPP